jgi:hypothetical protein
VPAGLSNVVALAAGDFHTYALKDDGKIVAWGDDLSGQIAVPATVTNATSLASGNYHGLALLPVTALLTQSWDDPNLVIGWNGPGVLQWAPKPEGPFVDLPTFGEILPPPTLILNARGWPSPLPAPSSGFRVPAFALV